MQAYPRYPIKCGKILDFKVNDAGNLVIIWEFEKGNAGETEIAGPVPETEFPKIDYIFLDLGHMTDWLPEDEFRKHYEYV